jgi:wyosine [tRNA(Phe)-imidazoG37] synthetase (radical SAM superfamily)
LQQVLDEIKPRLADHPEYITLSGSGEPTLYSRLEELIAGIKAMTETPIAVITNGSLLWKPEVRRELLGADLVIPSLDGCNIENIEKVNRPCPEITFERLLDGLIVFRKEFKGQYWLEVFLLDGLNASNEEVAKIADYVRQIGPDRVQLNTVSRPPAESFAGGISRQRLEHLAQLFDPPAEVIADFKSAHKQEEYKVGREEVFGLLKRRPCSIEDIIDGLSMHRHEVIKHIEQLLRENRLRKIEREGKIYYQAV